MNLPLINVDILHNVTQFADFPTVLQLTKTCRQFNAECAQYLLKTEGVNLEGEESVQSFIAFLTASGRDDYARRRFPFCTNIELSVGPNPSQSIRFALVRLFRSEAPRFRFLALHHSNALLAPDSPLPGAVAALTTLEELKLYEHGPHCAAMLPTMQSRLRAVKLALDSSVLDQPRVNNPPLRPDNDPLYLLHRSQETLESMNVSLPIALRQGFYPNLVELRIYSPVWLPLTWTLVHAFPRLAHLVVGFGTEFTQEGALMAVACRQWNIAEQQRLGTWTSLRRVQGPLEDLFLLGLTCLIPELAIDVFSDGLHLLNDRAQDFRRRQADAWCQVLRCARPSRLALYVDDSDWIVDNHGFNLLFETPELASLHSLHLVVQVSCHMGSTPGTLGDEDALVCYMLFLPLRPSGRCNDLADDEVPALSQELLCVIVGNTVRPVDLSITFDWTEWSALARDFVACNPEFAALKTDFPREELDAMDMDEHVGRFLHVHSRSVRYCHVGPDGWRREATYFRADVSEEERAAIVEAAEWMEMNAD